MAKAERTESDCPECGSELTICIVRGFAIRGKRRDTWACTNCEHQWEILRHA